VVSAVTAASWWLAPISTAISAESVPIATLQSVLQRSSAESTRSGSRSQKRKSRARAPPDSISDATRASPSAVSAVSVAEKKAERKSPTATAAHCQGGTKIGRV